ncbi:hypothetical protein ACN0TX_12175 [Staphylococcus cohnii]|uniref:hypothetical protein n=1 Tax=Staphylococcus cohnii TaxID=29382 RepID=UPI003AF6BDDF
MSEYIQWFVENVINKPFNNKELLSIWITQHKKSYTNKIITNQIDNELIEQMTIFDF